MYPFVNPVLPDWEYIPDPEVHVFGDRVYIYGSHDEFNGKCIVRMIMSRGPLL